MSVLTLPAPPPADTESEPAVQPIRWTREEYYRLAEDGYFAGKRVMLIDGEILTMCPQLEPHALGILHGLAVLSAAFGAGFTVRPQMPLDLGQTSDPEPDLAVVAGPLAGQPRHRPTTAALVVEVSDRSLGFDTGAKASLYAAGGITDYWVVDVANNRLVVFRDPRPGPAQKFGHGYAAVATYQPGESVAPVTAPTAAVAVADLLP